MAEAKDELNEELTEEKTEETLAEESAMEESQENEETHLSRAERKKLLKQKVKEERRHHAGKEKQKGLVGKIALFGAIGIVIVLLGYFMYQSAFSKPKLPEIGNHPTWGSSDAKVIVYAFGDYTCPFTKQFYDLSYAKLKTEYGDKIKFVYWPMITNQHNYDKTSTQAAYCAHEQGKHEEYMKILFDRQGGGNDLNLKSWAQIAGLDMAAFNSCYDSKKFENQVMSDYNEGRRMQVTTTPTLFINGLKIEGIQDYTTYKRFIDSALNS